MGWIVSTAALLVLSACSGSGSAPTATPAPTNTVSAAPGGPEGTPAPEALSDFTCAADGKKDDADWKATGLLSNDGKAAATYQVSVYVGPSDGATRAASTREVAEVKAGGSVKFEIDGIKADGSTCQVQVLRTTG